MGFSQSESLDALLQYSSVPEAAEYLVSMMVGSLINPVMKCKFRNELSPDKLRPQ